MSFSPGKVFRAATRNWIGPFARTRRIVKVSIRDKDFQTIRVLASESGLAAFCAFWSELIEVDRHAWSPAPGQVHYNLIVEWAARGTTKSSHWFYYPGGFVNLLAILPAIWVAPLYRAPNPAAFEALLRFDPSPPGHARR